MQIKRTKKKVGTKKYRLIEAENVSQAVEEDLLNEEGIVLFENDNVVEEYLQLPADITELPSQELGRYFNAFTQQKMYVRSVLGRLSAVVRERNNSLNDLRVQVFSSLPQKTSMKEKEIIFSALPEAKEELSSLFIYEEKYKMVSDYLESLIDAITLVSREISRRESDWNDNKREENISKKRR